YYFNHFFFFSSRRRHTRCLSDWSSDVCSSDLYKASVRERLTGRFAMLAKQLEGKTYIMGDQFTVADPYALYCLRSWMRLGNTQRSEERRVGKECRARWWR